MLITNTDRTRQDQQDLDTSRPWLVLAIGLGIYALIMATGTRLLDDPDSHWHVHVGARILAEGHFPQTDPYSHSFAGAPWIAKEWLSQVLFAAAHRIGGWFGVVALTALAAALAIALLSRELLARLPLVPALALTGFALLCTIQHLLARPHVLAMPAMVLWFVLLFRAAEAARVPSLAALPLMAWWSNLHGSFTFGLAFGGLLVIEAAMRAAPADRLRLVLGWGAFGLAALAAACLHPYGPEVIVAAFRVLDLGAAKTVIMEWRPQDFSSFGLFEAFLLAGLGLALVLGLRLSPFRTVLLLLLLHLALSHFRHVTTLGFIAPLVVAPALARRPAPVPAGPTGARLAAAMALGLAGLVAVTGLTAAAGRHFTPAPRWMPEAALAAARAAGLTGPVLNDYAFGGFLIARGVPTFIDGRAELYGGPFVVETIRAMGLKDVARLDAILDGGQVQWTLLEPSTPAVAYLDRRPGWRRVFADEVAVVHAREARR
ncbi:hypothetical protein C8P69_102314 [Phreatobacter oligotrophus]|uniref:4-amino-4-deoxy-L-arabinose transferase-like glycosyltransferase n=2 Tax=Phreatobacter oligotrophus TaxID=1122261 RepID=A0A2T4ZG81_9HYPH|nr:hypothetical protein C8P69_102314 [Phreatobacter oligotrophus]